MAANFGLKNIGANCWLNTALQLLDITDLPLYLQGKFINWISALLIQISFTGMQSTGVLTNIQKEYLCLHRKIQFQTADPGNLLVRKSNHT